jgi:general secretion pathway protein B
MVQPIQPPAVTPLATDPTFKSVPAQRAATEHDKEVLPTAGDLAAGGTSLPELKLDIHVYSKNPAERFVFINMRKYLEGQSLQEGPVLEKITTDGVVLNQHGLRYALPRQ